MIHTNRIVTVGEQECIIDRPIVLYRGDREVEIEFTLVGNEFMFSEEGNVIKSVNASHGQLVLNTPSGEHMFSELAECHEGKVVFVVTKEMIDEFIEMGFYSFQIRLYDSAEMKSRVTIPPVMNGFDIRNPIAAEDETNVVDQGIVDYARIFKDQSNEELPTFTENGEYVKTEWAHHDVITENKMNKIEDALYSINANIKESDVVMLNALDNVKKDADAYVKEHMAEVEQDVEDFERNLNTDVQQFKIDTNAAMTAHKNEVSEVVDGFSGEIESMNSQLAHIAINVKDFGAKGDGVNDDYLPILNAIKYVNSINGGTIIFPNGTYRIDKHIDGTELERLEFKDCNYLKIDGRNSVINIKGNFHRSNSSIKQLPGLIFRNCKNVKIENIEINGNANETTRASSVVESYSSGIAIHGCKNVTIESVYVHHMTCDGLYIADNSIDGKYICSKNIVCKNSEFTSNARQGMSIIQLHDGLFENCKFNKNGFTDGEYDEHSPSAGCDVEPNRNTETTNLDYNTGNIKFEKCEFVDNLGSTFIASEYFNISDIVLNSCKFIVGLGDGRGGQDGLYMGIPNAQILNSFIDLANKSMYTATSSDDLSDLVIRNCEFVLKNKGIVALNDRPLLIDGCKFYIDFSEPTSYATPQIKNNNCTIKNSYFFYSRLGYVDGSSGGRHIVNSLLCKTIENCVFETDLLASDGDNNDAFYACSFNNNSVQNVTFKGTNPGTSDTFHPSYGFKHNTNNTYSNRSALLGSEITFGNNNNVRTIRSLTSVPTEGSYRRGDYIINANASISGGKIIKGWIRVTNGSNNVVGVDWIEDILVISQT